MPSVVILIIYHENTAYIQQLEVDRTGRTRAEHRHHAQALRARCNIRLRGASRGRT